MTVEMKDEVPQSVKAIWEDMITRFETRTGQKLNSGKTTTHDLENSISAHCAKLEDSSNVARAKDTALKIISCFKVLGGIVAQGASIAFGPASVCFNALNFLLDIPEKVHGFHVEVNAIFMEVGPAITQFRIYERMDERTPIDESLLICIYDVMVCFVDLCGTCINIHNNKRKRDKVKDIAKRIFLEDKTIMEELERFKELTHVRDSIQSTLTLEAALESKQYLQFINNTTLEIDMTTKAMRTDVSGLLENDRKRTSEEKWKNNRTIIQKKLGVTEEQISAAIKARDHDGQNAIKDGGKWLNELSEYKKWLNGASTAGPLLLMTGGPGTGKSYLVSKIIHDIRSETSSVSSERCSIGYYSFSVTVKSDNRRQPEAAIKNICAQLAESDAHYAKRIARIFEENEKGERFFREAGCMELWTTLALGSPSLKTTHYIILHSVNVLSSEELQRLMEAVQQQDPCVSPKEEKITRARILATGESNAFKEAKINLRATPTVNITRHNKSDIIGFIEAELEREDLLQGKGAKDEELRRTVQERVLKRSKRNYLAVQQDLRIIKGTINTLGTEEELLEALQESKTDAQALGRSDLSALEAILKPKEIDEVNELLIWALTPPVYFGLDLLSAALFLRFKTIPVQPLAQRIKTKYSKIFKFIQGDKYVDLQENMQNSIVVARKEPRKTHNDHKITATITISNCSEEEVQHFFWDLNHHSFQKGFVFQPQSNSLGAGRRRIQLNMTDANFDIVKRAFHFFHDESVDKRGKPLGGYLMEYIVDHLKALHEAKTAEQLQPVDKRYIGSNIYEMFTEGDLIERNWEYCRSVRWYKSNEDLAIFWQWLDDSIATADLGPRDKKWLKEHKATKNPNRSLLTPVMTIVAEHWLRKTDWDPLDAFWWIQGFLHLGGVDLERGNENISAEMADQEDGKDADEFSVFPNESYDVMVEKAEAWSRKALEMKDVDHIWYIRLGRTYAQLNEVAAAVHHYKKAASILQDQEVVDKTQLCNVLQQLGELSHNKEFALGYFTQAHEQDPDNIDVMYNILKRCNSTKEEVAKPIIEKSVMETQSGTDSTILRAILDLISKDTDTHGIISMFQIILSLTSRNSEWWDVYQKEMKSLIEDARLTKKQHELSILLYAEGIRTYYRGEKLEDKTVSAMGLWRESVGIICKLDTQQEIRNNSLYAIKENALACMGIVHFERDMRPAIGQYPKAAEIMQRLKDPSLGDISSSSMKYVLAAGYSFLGQRDEALGLLQDEMVAAFNILNDEDTGNDWKGYSAILELSKSLGNYEASLQALQQIPRFRFDGDVLKALLVGEDEILGKSSIEIVDAYNALCSQERENPHADIRAIIRELWKRAQEADEKIAGGVSEDDMDSSSPPNQQSTGLYYRSIHGVLNDVKDMPFFGFSCDSCYRQSDHKTPFYTCKYCYETYFCDHCWEKLQSSQNANIFVCSRTHDWLDQGVIDTKLYVQACRRLVQVKSDDGSINLIPVKKWLGNLCDKWGLKKERWRFD